MFIFFLLLAVCGGETSYCDDNRKPSEYEVKAAYIYNFAKFVQWPKNAFQGSKEIIDVCVLGDDPFGSSLSGIDGKAAADKKIGVRGTTPIHYCRECEIIFISGSEAERLPRILKTLNGAPVLTVGDTEGYAEQGVMINFFMENRTVRFEINLKAAVRAGLKISSNLLRIARIVGEP